MTDAANTACPLCGGKDREGRVPDGSSRCKHPLHGLRLASGKTKYSDGFQARSFEHEGKAFYDAPYDKETGARIVTHSHERDKHWFVLYGHRRSREEAADMLIERYCKNECKP